MINNILTSDSYVSINVNNDEQIYSYVKTDNSYLCPYVFGRSGNNVYTNLKVTFGDTIECWTEPDGTGQRSFAVQHCSVLSYGIATIAEAAEIGGDTSSTNN